MEEYTSEQMMDMVGIKESRFKKWVLELERQNHNYNRVKQQRFFNDHDYLMLCDLKEIMDKEKISLKEGVRRVLRGYKEDLPVVIEKLPQDNGDNVTNHEVLQVIQKGFIEAQNTALQSEENFFDMKVQINHLTDMVHDLQGRLMTIENLQSMTHEEVLSNGRGIRDVAFDYKQILAAKKEPKEKKNFFKGWFTNEAAAN